MHNKQSIVTDGEIELPVALPVCTNLWVNFNLFCPKF